MSGDGDRDVAAVPSGRSRSVETSKHENDAEIRRITDAYARREERGDPRFARAIRRERERIYRRLLETSAPAAIDDLRLLEIGCGGGGELLRLIGLGLRPENLVGVELLSDRVAVARDALPPEVDVIEGDASRLALDDGSFDVVFASTVFSSVLAPEFRRRLAAETWRLLRPGGFVLWYDFCVDNPRNPDVRGVPRREIRALYPDARCTFHRTTLAPPIARRVLRLGAWTYPVLNAVPALRTHVVGRLEKPMTDANA